MKKRYFCDLDEKLAKEDPRKIYGGILALALCFSLIAYVVYTFAYPMPEYPETEYVSLEEAVKNVVTDGGTIDVSKVPQGMDIDMNYQQFLNNEVITNLTLAIFTDSTIGPESLKVYAFYDENFEVISCDRNYNEKQFESKIKRDMLAYSFGYGIVIVFFMVILEIWLASLSRKHKEHDLEKLKQQHNDSKEE